MRLARLSLPLLLLLVPSAATGQRPVRPLGGEPPTLGLRLDAPSLVESVDPSGVETNPAAVGLLDSWALMYRHSGFGRGRLAGEGDGLLFGTAVPYMSWLALGLGFQWLRPPEAIGYSESVKLSLALALRLKQVASLGLGIHGFIADHDSALDGLQSLDLGLALRPFEWLGGGLVVRNLNTPLYDGLPLQRVYDLELTGRPLRTDRLEIGAGLRLGERRGELDPYFRLEVEPLAGLRLIGGVEVVPRDYYRDGETTYDVRGTVAVGLNLEQIGLAFSTFLGRELDRDPGTGPLAGDDARAAFQGFGVTLRLSGARRAPLVQLEKKLLLVKLTGELDQRRWVKLVELFKSVEERGDVPGLVLNVDGLECGWGQAQEIRRWLRRLRRGGKTVFAYLGAPNDREYYIAAAADRLMLDPGGGVRLDGLVFSNLYLRGLLDWAGVYPQFIKIAEFKSAPESLTRNTGSPEAKRVREALLNDLFQQLIHDLAADRKKTPAKMRDVIDQGPFTPPRALSAGLVDRLVDPEDVKAVVEKLSGATLIKPEALPRAPRRWPVGPAIAVVVVEGDIISGKSVQIPLLGQRLVGDDTIAEALAWARTRSYVKAVVLRINSPGGSALASDRMWRAVRRLRQVKPVVVSLGDVAASGGYYVAAGGERIYAEPGTITGSIGIFTGKLSFARLLERVGIGVDSASRGKRATMESFNRPYTDEERSFILSRLQYYYRSFLGAVSAGRKMTQDEVHKVARGRVWTGRQAMGKGLVDRPGGLADAIEDAQRRAGFSPDRPMRLIVLPKVKKGLLGRLLSITRASEPRLDLPEAALRVLRALPPVLLRARAGEPLSRLPYVIDLD